MRERWRLRVHAAATVTLRKKHKAHVGQTWASQIFDPGTQGQGNRLFAVWILRNHLFELRRTFNHVASSRVVS